MESDMSPEFNLLREPWIAVLTREGAREDVSLCDAFRRAPEFRCLAGELPAQDTAVLRLLLAVLHSVFRDFGDEYEALDVWKELWDVGEFPYEKIERYLKQYEDRFWLFHPETPFYQAPGLDKRDKGDVFGPFSVAKLNGELSESDNKVRLFPQRSRDEKTSLSHAEAMRWLLYFNGFAETFGKLEAKGKTSKSDPSVGVGWLGKLGLISAVGDNLFQILMLNFVLLDDNDVLWENGKPIWELPVNLRERNAITLPASQAELLTLQSRRILLVRSGGERDRVISCRFVSGDIFPQEEAFSEQMTTWRYSKQPRDKTERYRPKPFQPSVQLWRDFAWLTAQGSGHMPGVVRWLKYLNEVKDEKGESILPVSHFRFQTSGISYGNMQAVITDVFSDSLSFNAALLSKLHQDWVRRIIEELSVTDSLVWEVGALAQNIAKASGIKDGRTRGEDGRAVRDEAKTQAYYRLDEPFRQWLESIDPEIDDTGEKMDKKCGEWWDRSKAIVRDLGREIVKNCSPQALTGRGDMSAPQAYNRFRYKTTNRETLKKKGGDKRGKSVKGSA